MWSCRCDPSFRPPRARSCPGRTPSHTGVDDAPTRLDGRDDLVCAVAGAASSDVERRTPVTTTPPRAILPPIVWRTRAAEHWLARRDERRRWAWSPNRHRWGGDITPGDMVSLGWRYHSPVLSELPPDPKTPPPKKWSMSGRRPVNARDLVGQTFGCYTVTARIGTERRPNGQQFSMWECRCRCGAVYRRRTSEAVEVRGYCLACRPGKEASAGVLMLPGRALRGKPDRE
jgi:hypothetical protein